MADYDPNDPTIIRNQQDLTSTGRDYIQNLNLVAQDQILFEALNDDPTFNIFAQPLLGPLGVTTSPPTYADLDVLFEDINILNGNPLPSTWEGFIELVGSKTAEGTLPEGYAQAFILLYYGQAYKNLAGGDTDWSGILDPLISPSEINETETETQFKAAFAHFLQTFPYAADGTISSLSPSNGPAKIFFETLHRFLTPISITTDDSASAANGFFFPTVTGAVPIAQYDQIYAYFKPDGTNFEDEFRDFYFNEVATRGYFHAGQALDRWVTRMWNDFESTRVRPVSEIITSGTGEEFAKSYESIELDPDAIGNINFVGFTITDSLFPEETISFPTTTVSLNSKNYEIVEEDIFGTTFYSIKEATGNTLIPYENLDLSKEDALTLIHQAIFNSAGPGSRTINLIVETTDAFSDSATLTFAPFTTVTSAVTSVSSEHTKRVLVLDRIFLLLAQIIGSLQSVAAAQAQQITFLANWQRVFTDMITQIETFGRGDNSIFGLTSSDSTVDSELTGERSDVNSKQVTRRETLSAWRGIVQDTAKREQTRVNQSQDAVSQQANMATAIIQQLTTLLGTIYR